MIPPGKFAPGVFPDVVLCNHPSTVYLGTLLTVRITCKPLGVLALILDSYSLSSSFCRLWGRLCLVFLWILEGSITLSQPMSGSLDRSPGPPLPPLPLPNDAPTCGECQHYRRLYTLVVSYLTKTTKYDESRADQRSGDIDGETTEGGLGGVSNGSPCRRAQPNARIEARTYSFESTHEGEIRLALSWSPIPLRLTMAIPFRAIPA